MSTVAHGRILSIDLDPVRAALGVVDVLAAADVPGRNDVSPTGKNDDPIFAAKEILFHGQPIFAVIAQTRDQARRAARLAKIEYEIRPHHLDPLAARAAGMDYVTEPLRLRRGEPETAMAEAPRRASGRFVIGGQDHFYLEGQIAMAVPGEDDEMTIFVSTQHPAEVQHMVAHALGTHSNAVVVNVRRMGGGFGGKETQMNLFACVAAIAARRTRRAVKIRPDRDDDMIATGKRHDFVVDYEVGFDGSGQILAVTGDWHARCGMSADLSGPVTDRALFHADNAYFYPDVELRSHPWRTHTVSNTAFRGFGGPQGVDRRRAHYRGDRLRHGAGHARGAQDEPLSERPDHAVPPDDRGSDPAEDLLGTRGEQRLCESTPGRAGGNAKGGAIRRGIALTPVKFGISFTATHYNQAGALVHVYSDGSIHLNHGGCEMGQGLHTKVAQVVADAFQVDIDRIKVTKTTTEKVPNTSATAASSGSDLNGMAALDACEQIKGRLVRFLCNSRDVTRDEIAFVRNHVVVRGEAIPFETVVAQGLCGARAALCRRFLRHPENPLEPGGRARTTLLLLRLWGRLRGGRRRHADRRIRGRTGRRAP